jgi:alpha-tubulin suppressor-like RCC1 family protein
VDVVGLTQGVVAVSASYGHTCALTTTGRVKCWGHNSEGQLGDGSVVDSGVPVDVSGLGSDVVAIAAGGYFTCALTTTGRVKCWGSNHLGQLGDGSATRRPYPVEVAGLGSGVRSIEAGFNHACAVTPQGGVVCWGYNAYGKLGDGSVAKRTVPVSVVGLASGVTAVSAGDHHSCVITTAGAVKCWGYNGYGQLGDAAGTTSPTPVSVTGVTSDIVAVALGELHTCALTNRAGVRCWGHNAFGQLGNGRRTNSRSPVEVDLTTHQTIELTASEFYEIRPGTEVRFDATLRPITAAAGGATARFEIYRQDDGVWRLAARRDVAADSFGIARLRWTFVTLGRRYVRALALANPLYSASPWSNRLDYVVCTSCSVGP